MTKHLLKLGVVALFTALVAAAPVQVLAQAKAADENKERKREVQSLPFNGKLKSVDESAKTLTIANRTFQTTSETKFIKDGKPATLEDGVVGEIVGGAYRKADDGKLVATSVRFGAKPEVEAKKKKAR
jgi:hypothetical protein